MCHRHSSSSGWCVNQLDHNSNKYVWWRLLNGHWSQNSKSAYMYWCRWTDNTFIARTEHSTILLCITFSTSIFESEHELSCNKYIVCTIFWYVYWAHTAVSFISETRSILQRQILQESKVSYEIQIEWWRPIFNSSTKKNRNQSLCAETYLIRCQFISKVSNIIWVSWKWSISIFCPFKLN